jgi:prepilin-type N-terminal cleavage/methylation domain-containing protein
LTSPHRHGFTLIELLVTVVIIGALASIMVPRFSSAKERAHVVTMRSDLRNAITAQLASQGSEPEPATTELRAEAAESSDQLKLSSGVTVTISKGTGSNWSAIATHTATKVRCAVFFGTAPVAPATVDSEIACG